MNKIELPDAPLFRYDQRHACHSRDVLSPALPVLRLLYGDRRFDQCNGFADALRAVEQLPLPTPRVIYRKNRWDRFLEGSRT